MTESEAARAQQYELLSKQHGGYWRHGLTDHAYLYNLHFPPDIFFQTLSARIHDLVLNYPVGQDEVAGLVGNLIGQPRERVVVGNGAAELIKIVASHICHTLIVPVPSFNEYANAATGSVVEFPLDASTFQLDVDEFAAAAIRSKADVAVVVSPNNPTSLLVPKADLVHLLETLAGHDCMLIVDESFIDFSSSGGQETLESNIAEYPNLAILKSMSKAYGICGLRLGYFLSANRGFRDKIRRGLSIWNINGFAEEFLRLAPDYREAFTESCKLVRVERDDFFDDLLSIEGLTVYRPQANFIFCRLPDEAASGPDIARELFVKHHIYTKHCLGKTMPRVDRYLRLASRTRSENQRLVEALRRLIGCD